MESRADTLKRIMILERFAAEANQIAAAHRRRLNDEAVKELKTTGAAPSWTIPALGKATLGLTKTSTHVEDMDALTRWVEHDYPGEVETVTTRKIKPGFLAQLLTECSVHEGVVIHTPTGVIVPGMAVRKGGQPTTITITPDKQVKKDMAVMVRQMLDTAHPELTAAPEPAEDDVWTFGVNRPWIADGDPFALYPPEE